MSLAMNLDDYSNFEKPILGPAGIARLVIALCGIAGIGLGLFGGISLDSAAIATGGALLAVISAGLFVLTRFLE